MTIPRPGDRRPRPRSVDGARRPCPWLPLAAVGVTLTLWASAFVAIRYLKDDFSAGSLSLGRLVVGSLALGAVALTRHRTRMSGRDWLAVAAVGVLWFGIYNVALNAGEQRVDAGTAVMLIQVSPLLIALLAAAFLGERFTALLGAGLVLAFAGVAMIALGSSRSGEHDVLGVALCLLSALVYSIALVAQKPVVGRVPALQVTWLACTVGAVVVPAVPGRPGRRRARGARCVDLVGGLPRRVPDRDRVHHLRLRAAAHGRRPARRLDVPRPPAHHRDGAGVPRRGAAAAGLRRRHPGPGGRGHRSPPAEGTDADDRPRPGRWWRWWRCCISVS